MSTQNVNVARFARNVEWDFFCDFQTPCTKLWFFFWLMRKKNLRRIFQAENDCSLSSIKSSGTTAQVHEFVGQHCHFMTLLKRRYHTVSSRNWKEEEFEKYVEWNCHLLAREKATCEKSWNISGIRIKIQSDTLYELF